MSKLYLTGNISCPMCANFTEVKVEAEDMTLYEVPDPNSENGDYIPWTPELGVPKPKIFCTASTYITCSDPSCGQSLFINWDSRDATVVEEDD